MYDSCKLFYFSAFYFRAAVMHVLMPGSPVCTVKLLLHIRYFSDELNDDDDNDGNWTDATVVLAVNEQRAWFGHPFTSCFVHLDTAATEND